MDSAQVRGLMEEQLRQSQRLKAQIKRLQDAIQAPVAVVGMAMRFPPGIATPDDYWEFLRSGGTALGDIPEDRPGLRSVYRPGPVRPGRSYVGRGAFLSDIAHFDADFFGISHREAKLLDPQQRMLLETTWEALERAGVPVRRSDRLNVGVYLGIMASEYSERLEDPARTRLDPYYMTGGGLCFAGGRISHVMGFSGPVVSVDTACSSSLTALHLAVRGLRQGDCRYALVCGSNLVLSANLMVSLCQTEALSPSGRCKSFLASADGYGRAEGVGAILLMRLEDAEQGGHPIHAVVRGTAVNHDGAASGLTVPNGQAQEEVIGAALADARTDPADIGYIEAHGTGTVLGDPIEVGAIDAAIGAAIRRRGTPLAIGSVKSRINHMEAASGIAAVMKTVLALQRAEIPAALDDEDGDLNPHIAWDRLSFTVPRRGLPWPATLPRRVAGVNSFGMSGTNAHAVLEAYESPGQGAVPPRSGRGSRPELLTLSAKTPDALADLAGAVGRYLEKAGQDALPAAAHTLRVGRAALPFRLAVSGTTSAALAESLAAEAERPRRAVTEPVRGATVRLAAGHESDRLVAAVAALAETFPLLGVDEVAGEPAERLAGILGRLGIPADVGGATADGATLARLEWRPANEAGTRFAPLVSDRPEDAPDLLVRALGELFASGANLDLRVLRLPGTRLVADLPTYPFRRVRLWVEEPASGTAGDEHAAAGTARAVAPDRPGGAVEPAAASGAPDGGRLRADLFALLTEVLDSPTTVDPGSSFLEVGGDSFILTLYVAKVQERYQIAPESDEIPVDFPVADMIEWLASLITAACASPAGERVSGR